MTGLPLEGLTVVSLEQAVAAPFATRQLADLGARVIKIERPEGDFARGYDRAVRGMSSYYVWLNRGKESVVLDLKSTLGQDALRALVASADVFVQNLAPGAIDRLGFGVDELTSINPRLIYVSVSGFGEGGPLADRKAYDLLVQCEAGLLSVTGTPEAPAKAGISLADIATGMYAYSGILTALLHRATTGHGDVIEVSMLEALGEWMMQPYLYSEYGGTQQPRSGAEHATIAPYGPFDTVDGVIYLAVQNDREWVALCEAVLRDPGLARDARFTDNSARVINRGDLNERIAAPLRSLTTAEARELLDASNVANAELRNMADFSAHPQLQARHRWSEIGSPNGPVRVLVPPVTARFSETRMGAVAELGQHTEAVLAELAEGKSGS
ncbi:MAG TPA: CaiB/BaiF CoA-transferase family protein [Galbitalea sp.]|jgi:crotonobetainyl-CoA:carnitine CoA-transferase CaiB-like acyl-CoA transferase|nr:CaiB/BaiF CoA-transferase family protein [Galbitalea sp.]